MRSQSELDPVADPLLETFGSGYGSDLKEQQEPEPEPYPEHKISVGAGSRAGSSFRIFNVKDLMFSETEFNNISNIVGCRIET